MSAPVLNTPLAIGLFDQIETEDRPASAVFDDHLALIDLAESAGFYGYYLSDGYPWVLACFTGTPDESFRK